MKEKYHWWNVLCYLIAFKYGTATFKVESQII